MAWQRDTAWRRLDEHGQERCVFMCDQGVCFVEGVGAVAINGSGLVFEYHLEYSEGWEIRRGAIVSRLGAEEYRLSLERRDDGIWSVNGTPVPEYAGCDDIDVSFTPSTNTATIRRLALDVGQQQSSRAVYVAEPELTLHVVEQTYRRTAKTQYAYIADSFEATIDVDDDGIVTTYPGLFEHALELVSP